MSYAKHFVVSVVDDDEILSFKFALFIILYTYEALIGLIYAILTYFASIEPMRIIPQHEQSHET